MLGAAGEETRWRSSGVPVACRGDGGGGASRHWQHALDRFRFTVGGMAAAPLNLVVRAVIPTSLYTCAVRQGATNHIRVGLSRSGSRDKGPIGRWVYWWRSTNILPLDLTTIFQFYIIYFCSLHYRLAHRASFIVTVNYR